MLGIVRLALRRTEGQLDAEYVRHIAAAKARMARVGIVNIDDADPLIQEAVVAYAKWQENFDGRGEEFHAAFDSICSELATTSGYTDWGDCRG